jgi:tetratricopeptide (TPR) repeat protein
VALAQTFKVEKKREKDELMAWLGSKTYWAVESRLQDVRVARAPDTLKWCLHTKDFKAWRTSETGTKEGVLWARGLPGMGKSVMAGYLVDELKRQYPKAVVAYFFCKRGATGLANVRDIIRTLAYQCTLRSLDVKNAIKKLKEDDFDFDIGIHKQAEELLTNPLTAIPEDVYIVLDGLDEVGHEASITTDADNCSPDSSDVSVLERNDLLRNLAQLLANNSPHSIRLLIISRPELNVEEYIHPLTIWDLNHIDNMSDIDIYVKQEVERDNSRLLKYFTAAAEGPYDYFRNHSGGMFLWVATVLKELADIHFQEAFAERLKNFSKASGDIKKLYLDILKSVKKDDIASIKEILRWLVATQRKLRITELQAAVEWTLKQHFHDSQQFVRFLERICGSLLRRTCVDEGLVHVELVHETIVSVLLDSKECPENFRVDRGITNGHAACVCAEILASASTENSLYEYALDCWIDHLFNAPTFGEQADVLLAAVHRFFTSQQLDQWIKYRLIPHCRWNRHGLIINVETRSVYQIMQWLEGWDVKNSERPQHIREELQESVQWCHDTLKKPARTGLGQYIGMVAARIWISGDVGADFEDGAGAFCLAWKYYRMIDDDHGSQTLDALAARGFKDFCDWVSPDSQDTPTPKSLGIAYSLMEKWDDAISMLEIAESKSCDLVTLQALYTAYSKKQNYKAIVALFERTAPKYPCDVFMKQSAATAYLELRMHDKAIELYEFLWRDNPASLWWATLCHTYMSQGQSEKAAEVYRSLSEDVMYLDLQIASVLGDMINASGEYDKAIKHYEIALTKEPDSSTLFRGLGNAYKGKGDHERAIEWYDKAIYTDQDSLLRSGGWTGDYLTLGHSR